MVQQMMADSAMAIAATRAALWQWAWEIDQAFDPRNGISALKVQGTELLGRVVHRSMQILAAWAFPRTC